MTWMLRVMCASTLSLYTGAWNLKTAVWLLHGHVMAFQRTVVLLIALH